MPKYPTVRVYFTEEGLKDRFNRVCFHLGRKMSDVIHELVMDWTQEQEQLIEEERRAGASGRLSANLPNLVGAYLLLTYRGTEPKQIERMARDCSLDPEQIKAALDGQPLDIDVVGKLASVLGMSLGELQSMAATPEVEVEKPLANNCR